MNTFTLGAFVGITSVVVLSIALAAWHERHRHNWTVWATPQLVYSEDVLHVAHFIDRCPCGRMRYRKSPLPTWWPMGPPLDPPREAWEFDEALAGLPRWRQRREREWLLRRRDDAKAREDLNQPQETP